MRNGVRQGVVVVMEVEVEEEVEGGEVDMGTILPRPVVVVVVGAGNLKGHRNVVVGWNNKGTRGANITRVLMALVAEAVEDTMITTKEEEEEEKIRIHPLEAIEDVVEEEGDIPIKGEAVVVKAIGEVEDTATTMMGVAPTTTITMTSMLETVIITENASVDAGDSVRETMAREEG